MASDSSSSALLSASITDVSATGTSSPTLQGTNASPIAGPAVIAMNLDNGSGEDLERSPVPGRRSSSQFSVRADGRTRAASTSHAVGRRSASSGSQPAVGAPAQVQGVRNNRIHSPLPPGRGSQRDDSSRTYRTYVASPLLRRTDRATLGHPAAGGDGNVPIPR